MEKEEEPSLFPRLLAHIEAAPDAVVAYRDLSVANRIEFPALMTAAMRAAPAKMFHIYKNLAPEEAREADVGNAAELLVSRHPLAYTAACMPHAIKMNNWRLVDLAIDIFQTERRPALNAIQGAIYKAVIHSMSPTMATCLALFWKKAPTLHLFRQFFPQYPLDPKHHSLDLLPEEEFSEADAWQWVQQDAKYYKLIPYPHRQLLPQLAILYAQNATPPSTFDCRDIPPELLEAHPSLVAIVVRKFPEQLPFLSLECIHALADDLNLFAVESHPHNYVYMSEEFRLHHPFLAQTIVRADYHLYHYVPLSLRLHDAELAELAMMMASGEIYAEIPIALREGREDWAAMALRADKLSFREIPPTTRTLSLSLVAITWNVVPQGQIAAHLLNPLLFEDTRDNERQQAKCLHNLRVHFSFSAQSDLLIHMYEHPAYHECLLALGLFDNAKQALQKKLQRLRVEVRQPADMTINNLVKSDPPPPSSAQRTHAIVQSKPSRRDIFERKISSNVFDHIVSFMQPRSDEEDSLIKQRIALKGLWHSFNLLLYSVVILLRRGMRRSEARAMYREALEQLTHDCQQQQAADMGAFLRVQRTVLFSAVEIHLVLFHVHEPMTQNTLFQILTNLPGLGPHDVLMVEKFKDHCLTFVRRLMSLPEETIEGMTSMLPLRDLSATLEEEDLTELWNYNFD